MRRAAAALALFVLLAHDAAAAPALELTLTLKHPLRAGETAWLIVRLGRLAQGQEIGVATASGEALGTLSPFAVRPGRAAGTYTLPVPGSALRDGHLSIRLTITQPGAPPRAPTRQEVRRVELAVSGAPK